VPAKALFLETPFFEVPASYQKPLLFEQSLGNQHWGIDGVVKEQRLIAANAKHKIFLSLTFDEFNLVSEIDPRPIVVAFARNPIIFEFFTCPSFRRTPSK
jgi:hypothetical protein